MKPKTKSPARGEAFLSRPGARVWFVATVGGLFWADPKKLCRIFLVLKPRPMKRLVALMMCAVTFGASAQSGDCSSYMTLTSTPSVCGASGSVTADVTECSTSTSGGGLSSYKCAVRRIPNLICRIMLVFWRPLLRRYGR